MTKAQIDAIVDTPVDTDWYPYLYGWLIQALAAEGVVRVHDFEKALEGARRHYARATR